MVTEAFASRLKNCFTNRQLFNDVDEPHCNPCVLLPKTKLNIASFSQELPLFHMIPSRPWPWQAASLPEEAWPSGQLPPLSVAARAARAAPPSAQVAT